MSCKHEGGTDPCKRNNTRHCVAHQKQYHKQYDSKYHRMNIGSANLSASPSNAGEACEYFVLADCLARGLVVTKPLNRNTPDDLHIKCGGGWMTVQVKSARRNRRTGNLWAATCAAKITSDIIALVFLPTQQIRYVANKREVPPELQTELTVLYGGNSCQFSSTSAPTPRAENFPIPTNVSVSRQTKRSTVTRASKSSKNSSGARQQNAAQASPAKETEA